MKFLLEADNVASWHDPQDFGGAAIPSAFRGTSTVPAR